MPDFGHALEFATFPEPLSSPPHHAVDLAVASETWGYDLVAFQDHPYQRGYLDAVTLMTWAAAKTSRVRIMSNVLNMALRSPAIVAKSAATIDLLSAGRLELGLGAGFTWDAIESVGGRRLTQGQAITALEEAITIIRGTWDTAQPGALTYHGTIHAVTGMHRSPQPGHPVPIWLGAVKPRMLRLVGRNADGWTAPLGRIQTRQDWQAASAIIDQSAADSGRDPAAIRRSAGVTGTFGTSRDFLQGPPGQWVEQLLPSVLEDGVGTFLLATDHRPTLQRFAAEVIPALRAAAAAERGEPSRGIPVPGRIAGAVKEN